MMSRFFWLLLLLLFFGVSACGGGKTGGEAFSIENTEPANNAENVKVNSIITLIFSSPIALDNIDTSQIILRDSNGLSIEQRFHVKNNKLVLTPVYDLINNHFYTVDVQSNFLLDGAQQLKRNYVFSFQTRVADDNTAPILLSSNPAEGDVDIAVNSSVLIHFDEAIKESSVLGVELYEYDSSNGVLGDRVRTNSFPNAAALTLTPIDELLPNTEYAVKVEGVTDLSGNVVLNQSWRFFTGFDFDTAGPLVVDVTPDNFSSYVPITRKIKVEFSEEIDLSTLSNRQFTVKNLAADRSLIGSVSYQSKVAIFQLQENNGLLEPSVDYLAEIKNVRDLAGNLVAPYQWQFTTNAASQPAPEVTSVTLQNSANGSGVAIDSVITLKFSEAVSVVKGAISLNQGIVGDFVMQDPITLLFYPSTLLVEYMQYTLTVNASLVKDEDLKYMSVDYVKEFTVGDETPPVVESLSHFPIIDAENVAINADISISFSEPLGSSRMDEYITVTQNGLLLTGVISLTANELRFEPANNFDQNALIHVFISNKVEDRAGNLLGEAYSWSFKSGDTSAPEVLSVSPKNFDRNVPVSQDIVINFAKGEIIDSSTVNYQNVALWNIGELERVLINFSVNGHQIILNPLENLREKTQYYLFVGKEVKDASGANISSPYNSVFTTEDRTPPVVEAKIFSRDIENGMLGVDQAPQIIFSEDILLETLTSASFYLEDSVGQKVAAKFDFNRAMIQRDKVRITPDAPLRENETYTLHLTNTIQDLYGNALAPIRWSFTIGDFTRPKIVFYTPANGAENIIRNQVLNIGFDEAMDKASVEGGFTVSPNIPGGFLWVGNSLAFLPEGLYDEKQKYTVSVAQSAKDKSGNTLEQGYSWEFTVGDYTAPSVSSVSPSINSAITSSTEVPLITLTFDETVNGSKFSSVDFVLTSVGKPLVTMIDTVTANSVTYAIVGGWFENALYHARYTHVLSDLSGNSQLSDVKWDFTSDSLLIGESPLNGVGTIFLSQGVDNAVDHYYIVTGLDATKQYVFNLQGLDANVDLNLSLYSAAFSASTHTCSSEYLETALSKTNEVCVGQPNADGEVYVKVMNNANIASSFDLSVSTVTNLKNAVSRKSYDYSVFDGLDINMEYAVNLNGFAEDLDLYVFDGENTLNYLCRSALISPNQAESCVFTATTTEVWVLVDGTKTSSDSVSYSLNVMEN